MGEGEMNLRDCGGKEGGFEGLGGGLGVGG